MEIRQCKWCPFALYAVSTALGLVYYCEQCDMIAPLPEE